jgi:TetR/AcrR family fatty acid metabolism transcriptional regulator
MSEGSSQEDVMPADQDPIRRQLVEARRNQILDAATEMFAEQGFHQSTTKDIARRAGIAEGTIYNYFESKDDLLIGMMARLTELETLGDELTEALQGDVRDFFAAMFRHRIENLEQAQGILRAILPEVIANAELREHYYRQFVLRVARIIEQYVQARIEMGHIRPVDTALATRVVQSMFVGLFVMRILGDETLKRAWDDLPELLATIIFDGLRAEGGD